jgi:predicted metalloprotease
MTLVMIAILMKTRVLAFFVQAVGMFTLAIVVVVVTVMLTTDNRPVHQPRVSEKYAALAAGDANTVRPPSTKAQAASTARKAAMHVESTHNVWLTSFNRARTYQYDVTFSSSGINYAPACLAYDARSQTWASHRGVCK